MNETRISLIIGGILSILIGLISSIFLLIYTLLLNNHYSYFLILSFGSIGLGVTLLVSCKSQA